MNADKGETLVAEKKEVSNLFIAQHENEDITDTVWLVDSGCSNHMSSYKKLFKNLDESQRISVRLWDKNEIKVQVKGPWLSLLQIEE